MSKSIQLATTALSLLLLTSCRTALPWNRESPPTEVNLAFVVERNLLYLPGADVNGTPGHVLFGSATPRTILDPQYFQRVRARTYRLNMGDRQDLEFTPLVINLGTAGDAVIGADVWDSGAVTVDYRAGLLTYQKEGIHPAYMTLFRYSGEPQIRINVDGDDIPAIVDTSVADTLILPRGSSPSGRTRAHVVVAGTDFGSVDVSRGDVAVARIGNRLLSRFLITIDYGKAVVGIWRDPRIPLREMPPAAPKTARKRGK